MARVGCHSAHVEATRCQGFTLVELITVAAIISVLIAILLPALAGARRAAKKVQCASNLRQLTLGLQWYASDNKGRFPANFGVTADDYWFGPNVIGGYISAPVVSPSKGLGGGVMLCPEDESDSQRSYAMNFWASSFTGWIPAPPGGKFWSSNVPDSASMILLTERWTDTNDSYGYWTSSKLVGMLGATPGQRFGGAGGVPPTLAGRWGRVNCELPYMRHAPAANGGVGSGGCINIAYADGHVATKSREDLVDMTTGLSTLDSWWSPADAQLQADQVSALR